MALAKICTPIFVQENKFCCFFPFKGITYLNDLAKLRGYPHQAQRIRALKEHRGGHTGSIESLYSRWESPDDERG